MPAIYDLANRGLLPPGFGLVGFARRDWADQDFAQIVHDSVREHARTPFREEVWKQLSEGIRFVAGDLADPEAYHRPEAGRRGARHLARHRRQPRLLPVHPAWPVPRRCCEHLQDRRGSAEDQPARWRRVVIEKPFGHDLAERSGARTASSARCSPSGSRVPDRPLPRQGDRPEHPRACASRTRMFEPLWNSQLRRQRADHDGRGHRHRRSRAATTTASAPPAT